MIPAWVDGRLTPVDKLDAHRRGLRHKAISAFVMRGDSLLIQRRAMGKYHTPGLWANTCCTHPYWNETAADCVLRRLDEELGIRGVIPSHRGQIEYRADVGCGLTEHEVVELFHCPCPDPLSLSPNPDEVMDTRWVSLAELQSDVADAPESFTPWLRIYLTQHAERIFGGPAPN